MSRDKIKKQRDDLTEERYRTLLRWRDRWTLLVYALGVATAAFLIAAIFLLVKESWLPGALSTVASIVTGAAGRWLLERRSEAVAEEQEAFERRTRDQKDQENQQERRQSRDALLGRMNTKKDSKV